MTRVLGIDEDIVHDGVRTGHAIECFSRVHALVKALGGSGVDHVVVHRILLQHAGATRGGGDALDFFIQFACVLTFVDAAACAGVDDAGLGRVDDDGEHVGVVDKALLDVVPGLAAVGGLPRQMPCAGVDDVGVDGIYCHRLDFVNFLAAGRTHLRPGSAGIGGAEDAVEGSREEHFRIGRSHGKGAN